MLLAIEQLYRNDRLVRERKFIWSVATRREDEPPAWYALDSDRPSIFAPRPPRSLGVRKPRISTEDSAWHRRPLVPPLRPRPFLPRLVDPPRSSSRQLQPPSRSPSLRRRASPPSRSLDYDPYVPAVSDDRNVARLVSVSRCSERFGADDERKTDDHTSITFSSRPVNRRNTAARFALCVVIRPVTRSSLPTSSSICERAFHSIFLYLRSIRLRRTVQLRLSELFAVRFTQSEFVQRQINDFSITFRSRDKSSRHFSVCDLNTLPTAGDSTAYARPTGISGADSPWRWLCFRLDSPIPFFLFIANGTFFKLI